MKLALAAELKKLLGIGKTPSEHAGRVLVVDGADVVGHRVVERLIDAEYSHLRVGTRVLHEKEETTGVELVPFVWEDVDTYDAALKDVKTVFVTTPIKPSNWDTYFPKFLKACDTNKVKRIVKMSFYHSIRSKAEHLSKHFGDPNKQIAARADGFHDVPFVHKHALCDGDLIRHKQFDVTILFASHLMSNIFRYGLQSKALKENNEFYGASGKGANYVSPNDIADVVVKVIFDKAHKRQAYTLTGPAAITNDEVATLLSEQLGTKITYVEKPLDFFGKDAAALMKIKASGLEEGITKGDTKKVLGKDPETFEKYLMATERMSPIENEVMSSVHAKEREDVTPEKKEETDATQAKEEEKEEIEPIDDAEEETEKIEPADAGIEVAEKKVQDDLAPEEPQPTVAAAAQ